jgi:hypothetical protein
MNNQDFSITIWADQEPATVYDTILDVRAWWSGLYNESFEGESTKIGDEFRFIAGGGMHDTTQRLVELVPNKKIVWLVTDANLTFVNKTDEWKGTRISFDISEEAGKTKIVFTHEGLIPAFQCYDSCAPAWTQYMQEQLKTALEKSN